MGILRLGYVHTRVTDLEEAKKHYGYTLGLLPVMEEPGRVFFKGWDEWDHHSVVIEEGGVGLVKMGYKVETEDDLVTYEKAAQSFGCLVERMSKGDNPEIGDGIRIVLPSGHVMELYKEATLVGTEVGSVNPEVVPRHLQGVGAPHLDHLLVSTTDVDLLQRFLREALNFYPVEQVRASLDDDAPTIGTWMSVGMRAHDIAVIDGPEGKLHHFAFGLKDWSDILKAGQLFSMDDVSIDIGPTQHGITRGETIYFFDPSGNRNEVFAGGYEAFRDRPTTVWTVDQLGKGIFYIDRELNERFTTVFT